MGASLVEQAVAADAATRAYGQGSFVTGLLGRVDLRSGVLGLVNAGHVRPLLLRGSAVTQVELPVDLPFGLNGKAPHLVLNFVIALQGIFPSQN